jgi:hypothetical protein
VSCDRTNYALLYVDTYYNSIGMLVCYIFYDDVAVLLVAFASCRPSVVFRDDAGEWIELDYNLRHVKTQHIMSE